MHHIKSSARRAAWRVGPDAKNYNPFARGRRPSGARIPDEEANLRSIQSNDAVPSHLERTRRDDTKKEFGGPPHPQTYPPTSANTERAPSNEISRAAPGPMVEGPSKESSATDETIVEESRNSSGTSTRRRKFLNFGRKRKDSFDNGESLEPMEEDAKPKQKLTLMVPVGIALNYTGANPVAVFVVNFIAIIPLAAMLSYATEEIALRVGETLGGLLNATFGNAVELIVSILALVQGKVLIVQTSLIGSMLSNLLLVMGMCFFFGGLNRVEQYFNVTVAQTAASLLALCVGSLIIPTAFHSFSTAGNAGVAQISRGTAVILLVVYGAYLFFQLKTHSDMYNEPSQKVAKRKQTKVKEGETVSALARMGGHAAAHVGGEAQQKSPMQDEEAETPQLSVIGAVLTLAISTTLVALCAEYMVSSINALTTTGGISETFVGLILLPIVGNAAEHATAVTVAIKDKMDLSIGVAVGSSMQIALLVLPFMVVLGWILGNDLMTLYFDGFQVACLFIAIILVNYLIQDGKSHWLEGVLLMATYLIIAVSAWFYPANGEVAG
ncbi:hypothetical protein B0A49_12827 [Cryomyces minteri]|uniref:Sodium/calcium exchanger membrane region domain-containing protein n=1 Tax=Cryomyces minteri TaxID=331657 RepID=A0A4U0VDF6_9PEZI|nr:hypothetical protein B0A49_12827 [Cryomyces minteri]